MIGGKVEDDDDDEDRRAASFSLSGHSGHEEHPFSLLTSLRTSLIDTFCSSDTLESCSCSNAKRVSNKRDDKESSLIVEDEDEKRRLKLAKQNSTITDSK